jgi:hypothetical protein
VISERLADNDLALRQLSREGRAGDRIGTKHGSDFGPDYRWNSCVPHLLAVTTHARVACNLCAAKEQNPTTIGEPHPSRQSFGTTRRVLAWKNDPSRKPPGLNP